MYYSKYILHNYVHMSNIEYPQWLVYSLGRVHEHHNIYKWVHVHLLHVHVVYNKTTLVHEHF